MATSPAAPHKSHSYLGWWIFVAIACLGLMIFGMALGVEAGSTTNDEIFSNPFSIFSEGTGQDGPVIE